MPHPSGVVASPDTKMHEIARFSRRSRRRSCRFVSRRGRVFVSRRICGRPKAETTRRSTAKVVRLVWSSADDCVAPSTFKPCVGAAFHAAEPRRKATGFRGRASAQAPTSVARHKPSAILVCGTSASSHFPLPFSLFPHWPAARQGVSMVPPITAQNGFLPRMRFVQLWRGHPHVRRVCRDRCVESAFASMSKAHCFLLPHYSPPVGPSLTLNRLWTESICVQKRRISASIAHSAWESPCFCPVFGWGGQKATLRPSDVLSLRSLESRPHLGRSLRLGGLAWQMAVL